MEKYRSRIEDICRKIASEMHLAVYDVEEKTTAKGKVIVVFVTKIGGVNLDECADFSRKLSEELDLLDFIPERYYLEVSSPGIERPLKLKTHYLSAINELVEIEWNLENKRTRTKGWLTEVNPDSIVVRDRDEMVEIPMPAIHKARTCFSNMKTREQL
ncbi:MAG: ribosome maturation factor RimP [Candidatus Cloacimonetes bacterium]|nr:ribosome maturation factor RimP [Candidatus Cloacimonadota bacterium]